LACSRCSGTAPPTPTWWRGTPEYRATPSIRRYVIFEQTHAAAIVFARKGDDWVSEIVAGDDAVLRLPEIGIEVPLAELYADVELAGTPGEDDGTVDAPGGAKIDGMPRS
jgi:hypothetical protein